MKFKVGKPHGATPLPQSDSPQPGWRPAWKSGLRWIGILVVLGGVGLGVQILGQHLFDPTRFPLRHVRLSGELHNMETGDLRALVENRLGQNFFALDLDTILADLAAAPWIEQISVQRRWPDTLEIHFQERVAFAYWGDKGEMVDIHGQRFHPPRPPREGGRGHASRVRTATNCRLCRLIARSTINSGPLILA